MSEMAATGERKQSARRPGPRRRRGRGGAGWRAWAALAVVLALTAAACGDDDDGASEGADRGAEAHDPEGVLRWARPVSASGPSGAQPMDPVLGKTAGHGTVQKLVYDTLLHADHRGSISPGLAESVEVVDPTTVRITLREGLTFSDGTPFDAEAVKGGLQRNIDSRNQAMFEATLFQIASITVESPTALTLRTRTPVGGAILNLLATDPGAHIVAPSAIRAGTVDSRPIGAGPFVAETVDPAAGRIVLRKNPNYYDADRIKLGGIELVDAATPESMANALRAGQADVIANVQLASLGDFEGDRYTILRELNPSNWANIQLCQTAPPFDRREVRQALNLAVDRKAVNDVLFEGQGEVMHGLWPEGYPFHDADLENPYATRDVEQARDLLRRAGVTTPVEVTVVIAANNPDAVRLFELVQQQAKDAGFELSAHSSPNVVTDYYTPETRKGQATALVGTSAGIAKAARFFVDLELANACDYQDPTLNRLVADLRATDPSDPEAEDLWSEIQQFVLDEALRVDIAWNVDNVVYAADRVGGIELAGSPYGAFTPDFTEAYVRAG